MFVSTWGLGQFRVWESLGFRVGAWDLGFPLWGSEFGVQGCRV